MEKYKHIKSGNIYTKIKDTAVKIERVWHDAVIYRNTEGTDFVRLKYDFEKNFKFYYEDVY